MFDPRSILPDDLIVFLDDALVPSCRALAEELQYRDQFETIRLTLLRGRELVEAKLSAVAKESQP